MQTHRSTPALWPVAYALALAAVGLIWYALGHSRPLAEPDLARDHKLQCVSYAPFAGTESPFDFDRGLEIPAARIAADLHRLAERFRCVRTYSTQGLGQVPALARQAGLQVLLGAWVNGDRAASQRELEAVIALARTYPDVVRAIIVGNEALLRKELTGEQLAAYIRQVKAAVPAVAVTYADVWEFWLKHPEVAPATDFITIHLLPYWEDDPTGVDGAMQHIESTYDAVARQIPGKRILIGETGWPSAGRSRQDAVPSPRNQARFVRGFVELAEHNGWQYNLIEAFDQPWKRLHEGAVGGYWGLYDADRNDKAVFAGPVSNLSGWAWLWCTSGVLLGLAFVVLARNPGFSAARLCAAVGFAVIGAVMLPLQGHQYAVIARNGWEYAWAAVLLGLATAVYFQCLRVMPTGRLPELSPIGALWMRGVRPGTVSGGEPRAWLRGAVLFYVLVETTGLVFDARYRSFNTFGCLIPALGYWLCRPLTGAGESGRTVEKWIALLLAAGGVFILINERPTNLEAVAWTGVCLALAVPLWRESHTARLAFVKTVVPVGLSLYAAGAVIRYQLMEATRWVGACAMPDAGVLCSLRDAVGVVIHFQGFGWLSLLGVAAALATRRQSILWATFAVSLLGLTLYNASLSAFSFVITVLLFAVVNSPRAPQAPQAVFRRNRLAGGE